MLANYSVATEPWYPWLAARVAWPPHGDVLEIGCGSGLLWINIAPLLPPLRLTLTDLSEGMVAAAAAAVAPLPGIELTAAQACDAESLPFDDASFEVAMANHMLYHVPDPALTAAELARVLRPGGVLLAATNGPHHLNAVSDLQVQVFGSSPRELVSRRFGKENGAAILGRAFASVEWHDHPGTLECPDPDAVVSYIASTALAQESPPEKMDELRAAVDARFAADGGVLRAPIESGCFVARGPLAAGGNGRA